MRRAVAWVTRLSQGAVLLVVAFVFWRAVRARERLLQAVVAVPVLFVSWGATAIVWQDWESTDEEVERVSDQASTGHLLTAPISCTIEDPPPGVRRHVLTVVQGAALAPLCCTWSQPWRPAAARTVSARRKLSSVR